MADTAGSRWRLLVHDPDPGGLGRRSVAHDVHPRPPRAGISPHSVEHVLPGTVFDELVVGSAIHIEELGSDAKDGSSHWWMAVAGAVLEVDVDPQGNPTALAYYAPGESQDPVPGCTYMEGDRG